MQCRNCGAQNGNVRSCTNCGAPLIADPSASNYSSYNNGSYNNGGGYNGSYNNGSYNNGSYNNDGYNSGYPNNGGYNSGYPNNGGYNSGYPNNGGYNSGYPNNGGYNGGGYDPYNSYNTPAPPKKKKTALIVSLSAAAVALITGLILLLVLTGPNASAKRVAKKAAKAMFDDRSTAQLIELMHPGTIDAACAANNMTRAQLMAQAQAQDAQTFEQLAGVSIDYKIGDATKMSSSEIQMLQANYSSMGQAVTIKDARSVQVTVTSSYAGQSASEYMTFVVVKIGGKWYLDISLLYSTASSGGYYGDTYGYGDDTYGYDGDFYYYG